jgi:hypothetical protein
MPATGIASIAGDRLMSGARATVVTEFEVVELP